MKLMVSLLLLAAISHAEEASRSNQEDEERTAKRELLEGNFGLKIQPSYSAFSTPRSIGNANGLIEGTPQLGSPTTFEVSQPVPSQLAYSEHKIYQETPNIQTLNGNLQLLNQNQPTQRPEQLNPFPSFAELQQPRTPQPILTNQFLPSAGSPRFLPNSDISQQIYQQLFSQQSGVPQDMYRQINELGNQVTYEETIQISQGSDDKERGNSDTEKKEQQQQTSTVQNASQTQNSQEQGQKIDNQAGEPQNQSSTQQSTTDQPQAISYASFSQSLPVPAQRQNEEQQNEEQQEQETSSPETPTEQQELSQPQSPPELQPQEQSQDQSTLDTPTSSASSSQTTDVNQTPNRDGVVQIGQQVTTPQPFTSNTLDSQSSPTSSASATDNSVNSQSTTQQKSLTSRFSTPLPPLQPRPTFRRLTFPTPAPRTTSQFSPLQLQNTFVSRSTLPPLSRLYQRQQTSPQVFSTFPSSTFPSSTFSPQTVNIQSLPTLPSQPVIQSFSNFPTVTPQPVIIQPTVTPLPLFEPHQIQTISTQPQFLSTPQPLFLTQSQPLSTFSQPDTPSIRPIPVQRQQYQIKSEPRSAVQVQEQSAENSQQPPQQQLIQGSQQIQQQLQSIQQQLQHIQQQQQQQQQLQLIQQQPQPVQITQQNQPFPQPIQLTEQQQVIPSQQIVQQQPILQPQLTQQQSVPQQLQPVQLIQQQPQEQPQSIQQQPQIIQRNQQQQIQQAESSPRPQVETQPRSQPEQQENKQKSQQKEKPEKQETVGYQPSKAEVDFYSQLFNNNLYSDALYLQPQQLHPVPVAFPSFAPSSLDSSIYSSPSLYSQSYPSASPFPSIQYFGKYAPGIFGSFR